MTLDPILTASPVIILHTAAALVAFAVGPVSILRRKRDWLHRQAGYLWVSAMAVCAVTALGIFELRLIGPFSPLHALPFLVGFMLWRAIRAIRAGEVVLHGRIMTQLYIWSMLIPGLFTLLPGRRMNMILFGGENWGGFAVAALLLGILAVILWRAQPAAEAHFPLHKV